VLERHGDDVRLAFSPNLKICSNIFQSILTLGLRTKGRDSISAFIYEHCVEDLQSLELNNFQVYRDKCASWFWENPDSVLRYLFLYPQIYKFLHSHLAMRHIRGRG